MREAVRVWRGVRGLGMNVRDGLGGLCGSGRVVGGFERRDLDWGWRAEDGRRRSSLGVAFMLAGLFEDVKRMCLSIPAVNMY